MTLKELQENLKFLVDEGVDEGLQVRVYAGHGQVSMSAGGVGIGYIDEDTYMPESVHPEDMENNPEDYKDVITVVEIWG